MALASALNTPGNLHRLLSSSRHEITRTGPATLVLPRHLLPARFSSAVALASRKNHRGAVTSSTPKIKKKSAAKSAEEEDEVDGDAIDALFSLLEEDLRNNGVSFDDDDGEDDEISEEDLARLEQELVEAFGAIDEDEDVDDEEENEDGVIDVDVVQSEAAEEEDEEDDEVEVAVKLKTWQFRRLASALKVGRRKTSIKTLAAELCLDRALVLQMLRDPPPNLLMLSAALPDVPDPKKSVPEPKPEETIVETTVEPVVETTTDAPVVESAVKAPVHVRQQKFSAQKRLKKVHIDTLERVYRRTKRPTNAMVSSIVHVTNLLRKRIVKWFEDKRSEEGVPDSRRPYQPSTPTTVN